MHSMCSQWIKTVKQRRTNRSHLRFFIVKSVTIFSNYQQHIDTADVWTGKTLTTDVDYLDTWRTMEKLVESGRVRSIGISNFNSQQTDRILSIAKILPVTNQVECHPNLNQRKLIDFSAARNVSITAYSPLGRPHTQSGKKLAISDAKVLELAQKYKKTPAQIILRYTVSSSACARAVRARCTVYSHDSHTVEIN